MKNLHTFGMLAYLCLLLPFTSAAQQRGDIARYERLEAWSKQGARQYVTDEINGLLDGTLPFDLPSLLVNVVAQMNYPIDVYKVEYYTEDFDDKLVVASGAVLVPKATGGIPMAVYDHGTVFNRQDVPSNMSGAGDGLEFLFVAMYAGSGYLSVAPDYLGMGVDDNFHPYVDAKTQANATIDNMRAARNLCSRLGVSLNGEVFLTGYSQGGHAAASTMKAIKDKHSSEFNVKFASPGSGPYDLSGLEFNYIFDDPYYPTREYALYVIASCQTTFGNLYNNIGDYLKPEYVDNYNTHILGQTGVVDWVPLPWTNMFNDNVLDNIRDDANHPLRSCLKASDVYNWKNEYRTHYYYTSGDKQVDPDCSTKARDTQRGKFKWWEIWKKYRIKAMNVGLFGLLDHPTTSVTSFLASRIDFNAYSNRPGAAGSRINKPAIETRPFSLEGRIALKNFSSKVKDVAVFNMKNELVNTRAVEIEDDAIKIKRGNLEAGIYLVEVTDENNEKYTDFIKVDEIEYMYHPEYDPLLQNPMIDRTTLDLSLLDEYVNVVKIYDEEGYELAAYENANLDGNLEIERGNMEAGKYTVEVQTNDNNYYLELKVADKAFSSDLDKGTFSVYPNPIASAATIQLDQFESSVVSVKLLSLDGKVLQKHRLENNSNPTFTLERGTVKAGMYLVEVITADQKRYISKVVMK